MTGDRMVRSFYDLAFGVDPGGARKDTHYVRGSLEEVRHDLAAELAEEINLYLLCWYGARLTLDVYQQGKRTDSIDLHPFLTISVAGHPDITFTGPGEPVGYDFEADEDAEDETTTLSHRMFAGELGDAVEVTVDWDRIEVPPLIGEVAREGDRVALHPLPGRFGHTAEYGCQDFGG
ncbi:hypothetical protein [Streptomyces sudanensis]|uniref:hypothetical protein n=1 Tax=Streptomyces sudanensis TaxID=436397 RepID=UPI0020CD77C3|nr:hypothetical protein [Streptomyces sudanensis]MCP9959372.1 hypothetical protein [Streptomyces sudanensis]MCQ0000174.1 hypothetical protein [Streptomyces sudanensis]